MASKRSVEPGGAAPRGKEPDNQNAGAETFFHCSVLCSASLGQPIGFRRDGMVQAVVALFNRKPFE